jgi:hypothetical protein
MDSRGLRQAHQFLLWLPGLGQLQWTALPPPATCSAAGLGEPVGEVEGRFAVVLEDAQLTITGRARPLDDLTLELMVEWLEYRRRRWPSTANLNLLINNQTANTTSRASNHWISAPMRGQDATLERLRVDRQLEEALTHGPDPLHLAEVFGLDEKTAMRYADSARALLEQATEQHLR